jgi:hypothetical protein
MKYQDALALKNSKKENPFFKDGIEYVWMVVPKTKEYLAKYAEDSLNHPDRIFFDEDAIEYAKDGLFTIFGVKMKR